jgi:hypothetical protein
MRYVLRRGFHRARVFTERSRRRTKLCFKLHVVSLHHTQLQAKDV